jgi:hypothetical protein
LSAADHAAGGAPYEGVPHPPQRDRTIKASGSGPGERIAGEDPLARVVFALVVLATFAALGLTQWLKHAPTAVQQLEISPATLIPGSAGEAGVERFEFHIQHSDHITVGVIDSQGDTVRTVTRHLWLRGYKRVALYWKGRQANGRLAPTGTYRLRIYLERQKREVLSPVSFELLSRGASR